MTAKAKADQQAEELDLMTGLKILNAQIGQIKEGVTKSSSELSGDIKMVAESVERKIDDGVARALARASEDRKFWEQPTFQIATGVAVLGIAGYFIHSNRQKAKTALGMAGNNTKFLASLGAENTEDGLALLNVSRIGK